MSRVLVVDDEPQLLRALRITLTGRGHDVRTAADGKQALADASAHPPDVIILDLGLPDMDGIDVIHGLRGWATVPIIVLSGRVPAARDKVEALDAGADDYVTKPFGVDELLARLRAVGRRTTGDEDAPRRHHRNRPRRPGRQARLTPRPDGAPESGRPDPSTERKQPRASDFAHPNGAS